MRLTKFYDLPLYYDTREKLRRLKKKRKANSYDDLMKQLLKEIGELEF